jgi:hypothetical protein
MRVMTALNVANNNIGELVLPEGWANGYVSGKRGYTHSHGREQLAPPAGSKPEGVIALANVIPGMRAMTSLNLASNMIDSEGAKHVAGAMKVSVVLRLFWYQFHTTSDQWFNCCCLPLSAGYEGVDELRYLRSS